jgi:hypothetical protein
MWKAHVYLAALLVVVGACKRGEEPASQPTAAGTADAAAQPAAPAAADATVVEPQPESGATALPADREAALGPFADADALCAKVGAELGAERPCDAKRRQAADVGAPLDAFALLRIPTIDMEDGTCIAAMKTNRGWFAHGWSCEDPMIEKTTAFVGAAVEGTGDKAILVLELDVKGHGEDGEPITSREKLVCALGDDSAPPTCGMLEG